MATIGNAPCSRCQLHIYDIRLVPGSKEPADDGGSWWRAEPGQSCPNCGAPFNWYHVPAASIIEFSTSAIFETVGSES